MCVACENGVVVTEVKTNEKRRGDVDPPLIDCKHFTPIGIISARNARQIEFVTVRRINV